MPELVTCPSCGFKTQTAESLLGRRVRCPGCGGRFVAEVAPDPPPPPAPPSPVPVLPPVDRPRPRIEEEFPDDQPLPFCPGCGKRVRWEAITCPHCGEELEDEGYLARVYRRGTRALEPRLMMRRDGIPHRGKVIYRMGNACLILGGLSLCILGLPVVICLPLGLATWVMANNDLEQMRQGTMDPRGRQETETGRTGAVVGLVISLVFAAFYLVVYSGMF